MTSKPHRRSGKFVEMGGLDQEVTSAGQRIATKLVECDEQNVRPLST